MRPAHLFLAVLVAAVWGVNFTVIEIGLGHFPPLLFSALRFLPAAPPLGGGLRRGPDPARSPGRPQPGHTIAMSSTTRRSRTGLRGRLPL